MRPLPDDLNSPSVLLWTSAEGENSNWGTLCSID